MEKAVVEIIVLSFTDVTSERLGDGDNGYNFSRIYQLFSNEPNLILSDLRILNKISELLEYKEWYQLNCCYGAGEIKCVFPIYYFDTNREIDYAKTKEVCELQNSSTEGKEYVLCTQLPKLITNIVTNYIPSDNPFLDYPWESEITKFDMDNSSCPYQIYPFKSITCC